MFDAHLEEAIGAFFPLCSGKMILLHCALIVTKCFGMKRRLSKGRVKKVKSLDKKSESRLLKRGGEIWSVLR